MTESECIVLSVNLFISTRLIKSVESGNIPKLFSEKLELLYRDDKK